MVYAVNFTVIIRTSVVHNNGHGGLSLPNYMHDVHIVCAYPACYSV